jgi:hypothetical protein
VSATIVLYPDVKRRVTAGFDLDSLKRAIEYGFGDQEFEMAKPSPSPHLRRWVRFTAADVVAIVDGDRDTALAAQAVAA